MLISVEYFRPTYRLLQTSLVSAGLPLTTSLPINTCSSYDTPLSLTPPKPLTPLPKLPWNIGERYVICFSYKMSETISFNLYILYHRRGAVHEGTPNVHRSQGPHGIKAERKKKISLFCEPLRTHPKEKIITLL